MLNVISLKGEGTVELYLSVDNGIRIEEAECTRRGECLHCL